MDIWWGRRIEEGMLGLWKWFERGGDEEICCR